MAFTVGAKCVDIFLLACLREQRVCRRACTLPGRLVHKHGHTLILHERDLLQASVDLLWGLNTDTLRACEGWRRAAGFCRLFSRSWRTPSPLMVDTLRSSAGQTGNDHWLGAQEAPPAITSLGTGMSLGGHLKDFVAGGSLEGCGAALTVVNGICNAIGRHQCQVRGSQPDRALLFFARVSHWPGKHCCRARTPTSCQLKRRRLCKRSSNTRRRETACHLVLTPHQVRHEER